MFLTMAESAISLKFCGNEFNKALLVPEMACWIWSGFVPGRSADSSSMAPLTKTADAMARLSAIPPICAG